MSHDTYGLKNSSSYGFYFQNNEVKTSKVNVTIFIKSKMKN